MLAIMKHETHLNGPLGVVIEGNEIDITKTVDRIGRNRIHAATTWFEYVPRFSR